MCDLGGKAPLSFEASGIQQPMTGCHIPGDWCLQQYHFENLKPGKDFCISEGLPKLWKSEENCIVWRVLSY